MGLGERGEAGSRRHGNEAGRAAELAGLVPDGRGGEGWSTDLEPSNAFPPGPRGFGTQPRGMEMLEERPHRSALCPLLGPAWPARSGGQCPHRAHELIPLRKGTAPALLAPQRPNPWPWRTPCSGSTHQAFWRLRSASDPQPHAREGMRPQLEQANPGAAGRGAHS